MWLSELKKCRPVLTFHYVPPLLEDQELLNKFLESEEGKASNILKTLNYTELKLIRLAKA